MYSKRVYFLPFTAKTSIAADDWALKLGRHAQNAETDSAILDKLFFDSANYFRAHEEKLLS